MSYIPIVALLLGQIAQVSPPLPTSPTSGAAAEKKGIPSAAPAAAQAPNPGLPAKSPGTVPGSPPAGAATQPGTAPVPTDPETEADKFVGKAAETIDAIPYVKAEIRQTIRIGEDQVRSVGTYLRGPGYRTRLQLKVRIGESVGERLQVSNGKMGYIYQKILDTEALQMIRIDQVMPLIERKELPPGVDKQLLGQLPFVQPGNMLRGYLRSVTFTKMTHGTLNDRPVTLVEGQWRKPIIASMTNQPGAEAKDLEMPQYLRLYLDKESSWPLKIEMFRRDKMAEYHPIFAFEFLNVSFPKTLPDAEFNFTPPAKVTPQDMTTLWVNNLQQLKDKEGAKPVPTGGTTAGAVSQPLPPVPATKKASEPTKTP